MERPDLFIFLKTLTGKTVELDVQGSYTVRKVKDIIQNSQDIAARKQILLFGGEELIDSNTLESYGIANEDLLTLKMAEVTIEDPKPIVHPKSAPTITKTSTSIPTPPTPQAQESDDLDEGKKKDLLSNFVSNASSNNVEIVFSFDTTGSMMACLEEVRRKVKETTQRLIKDIPKIRIGIIAHGDYCDFSQYVISTLDLTDDAQAICTWIDNVKPSSGGDAPEAYEYALKKAKKFSWTKDYSKALVIIGDDIPHPPSYTTKKINWFNEVDALASMGVKVYGVRALNNSYAIPFYETISERSGAISISFKNFHLIVDMFLAICYREASNEKLQQFKAEVKKEGKMNSEMNAIFDTLSQPNQEITKKKEKEVKWIGEWYNIEKDNGTCQYDYDRQTKKWKQYVKA